MNKNRYSEFLFHFDSISQSLNDLVIEVIASKVNSLQSIHSFQDQKGGAQSVKIDDFIILKSQLDQIWSLSQVFLYFQCILRINVLVQYWILGSFYWEGS